jgi:iron-sulfur cluster repair protein YtfE (RIC family)
MRCYEFIARKKKVLDIQPAQVQRQQRINNVVSQIAASDQQQQPTETDKVMAMQQYANMKQQVNRNYANSLRQQLANMTTTAPTNKRKLR